MNARERVQAAVKGERTDAVPVHHLGFSSSVASALLGREAYVGGGSQRWREARALWQGEEAHRDFVERSYRDAVAVALHCGHDILRVSYWRHNVQPTRKLDEHTYLYEHGPEEDWRILRYDPASEECAIATYRPRAAPQVEQLEREVIALEEGVADYAPSAADFIPEMRAMREMGDDYIIRVGAVSLGIPTTTVWLEAMARLPDLVARYLEVQVERAARNVAFLSQHGFRLFWGGGDFSSNAGPMYSPRLFRELLLPRLQRISDACHEVGGYHLFASDGDLWPVADDLFGRSGVDGFYEIDRRAGMDLERLRQRFPGLVLIGNISSHTVHIGTRQETLDETRSCLEAARRVGGIIVGVSNYFVANTPIENVNAVLETIAAER